MSKNLFGNLLKNENIFQASTIVEDLAVRVPQRDPFYCTSPTMSWGTAAGFQPGTMELLYGPKSSGKTMIVLDRIKQCQRISKDTIQLFVDAELGFEFESTVKWMKVNGVDIERVAIIRQVCIKEIFEKTLLGEIQQELKAGNIQVDYIPMDSIQAMSVQNIPSTEKQIASAVKNDGFTKGDYGARANYLAKIFPFFRMFCRDFRIFTTFVGQARSGGTDFHGNQIWTTNGGEALYHEVQYRQLVLPAGIPVFDELKSDANGKPVQIGHRIKFTFEKNKMGEGHQRKGYFDIIYLKGIVNKEEELIVLCSKLNIVEIKGAWYYLADKKFNGSKQAAQFLIDNPDEYQTLFNRMIMQSHTAPSEDIIFDKETGEIKE